MGRNSILRITSSIQLAEQDLAFEFIRSSGPGGQNVNKVATAVQLRFDARRSSALPEDVRIRLLRSAGRLATSDGEIIIQARRFRSQEKNKVDAIARLTELIIRASHRPAPRKKTAPSQGAKEKRMTTKRRIGVKKRLRARTGMGDY